MDEGLLNSSWMYNLTFPNLQPLCFLLSPSSWRRSIKPSPQLAVYLPAGQNFGAGKSGRPRFMKMDGKPLSNRGEEGVCAVRGYYIRAISSLGRQEGIGPAVCMQLWVQLVMTSLFWCCKPSCKKENISHALIQSGQLIYILHIILKIGGWRGGM